MGDPTPLDTFRAFERAILSRVRTWLPGEVQAYDPATGRARVAVGLMGSAPSGVAAQPVIMGKPVIIPNVPVVWARGAGMGDVGMLDPGDTGSIFVSSRAIDRWLVAGGIVPLESDRAMEWIDAEFVPGLSPLNDPPPAGAAVGRLWGREDGTCTITATRGTLDPVAPQIPGTLQAEADAIRLGLLASFGAVGAAPGGGQTALDAAITALTIIVGTPIPEPPLPGAGAAIDAIAAALLALLQTLAISTKVTIEGPP